MDEIAIEKKHLAEDLKKLQGERNTVMAEYTMVMGERDQAGVHSSLSVYSV